MKKLIWILSIIGATACGGFAGWAIVKAIRRKNIEE